jgi:hypothetical protein
VKGRGRPFAGFLASRPAPAGRPAGEDDVARAQALGPRDLVGVARAQHERVDLDVAQRVERPRRGDHHPRAAGEPGCRRIPAGEVDRVALAQALPRKRIGPERHDPLVEHGDRPLTAVVEPRDRPPRRARGGVHGHPVLAQPRNRHVPGRREELAGARQPRQLHGRHPAAAPGVLPHLGRPRDLPGRRHPRHAGEGHPLDVADDGDLQ